jgi:DHA2 family multidrug resistance protein
MNNPTTRAGWAPQRGLAYKWKVLIAVIFGIFMVILDGTVVNVALQTLREEFNVALADAQWIISIYILALGVTTPLSGFLADRFGIKQVYIAGQALFVCGSLLCGLAPTLALLIAARVIQGIGGGLAQPLGPALLYRAFPPEEQGVALGYFGIALVVAPALGPILGGLLVQHGLWRAIFFINVPIGIVGVGLATRFLRRQPPERRPTLDPLGIATAVLAFGALLYAASNAANLGWTSSTIVIWFAVGVLSLLAFIAVELFVAKEPLLELRLFRSRQFALATVVGYVTVLGLFGAEFLMPLYLQALRGRTPLETGLLLLPLALTSGVTLPLAGRIYDRIGPRALVTLGFGLLLINTWQLAQIQALTPLATIMELLALRGVAIGLIVQTTFTTALGAVPLPLLPRGSALVNSTRFVVQSIGVAVLATVLVSAISPATQAFEDQAQAQLTAQGAAAIAAAPFGLCETPGVPPSFNIPPVARQTPPAAQAQSMAAVERACQENLAGFERAYKLTFYAALIALALAVFLPGWPLKWAGRGAAAAALAQKTPSPAP